MLNQSWYLSKTNQNHETENKEMMKGKEPNDEESRSLLKQKNKKITI
jgi:hypothetical protein